MRDIKLRIIASVVAGLLIVSVMTACSSIKKPDDQLPLENPSQSSDEPGDAADTQGEINTDTADISNDDVPDNNTPDEPETSEPDTSDIIDPTAFEPEAKDPIEPEQEAQETDSSQDEPEVSDEETEALAASRTKIASVAAGLLGTPFAQGGSSPEEGFDSTGFTYYCAKAAGFSFPRSLSSQLESGELITFDNLRSGDIVYFSYEEDGEAKFCGVYVGGGLMIYSPVPDDYVKTANITTNYWTTHFVTGLRIY